VEPETYGVGGDSLVLHYWWSRLGLQHRFGVNSTLIHAQNSASRTVGRDYDQLDGFDQERLHVSRLGMTTTSESPAQRAYDPC